MSSYEHEKVIRLKLDILELARNNIDGKWELEDLFPDKFGISEVGKFEIAPTEDDFLDLILEHDHNNTGDWGTGRYLTEEEVSKYLPLFQEMLPFAKAEDLRYIEFCWYNCSEAPDYFE